MATVYETYAAALRHGSENLPAGTRPIGVVRRPMGWFHAVVEENLPALGPPVDLLDEVKQRQAALGEEGLGDVKAAHRAWADVDFDERYREHLDEDPEAEEAMDAVLAMVRDGTGVALVCYEGPEKPCHRHPLRDRLLERLER